MIDIKLFRKDNNLTQDELANILECTQGFISSMEQGKRPVPENIITKLISDNKYNIRYMTPDPVCVEKEEGKGKFVSISAEAWEVIKKQADSLAARDRQIDELVSLLKKDNAHPESNVGCADASGFSLEK